MLIKKARNLMFYAAWTMVCVQVTRGFSALGRDIVAYRKLRKGNA